MIWPRTRTIPTATLPYPAIGEFDFRSILFESNPVNERAHPRYILFPPPSCGAPSLIVVSCNLFPIDREEMAVLYFVALSKGKEILGSRRNDDASTAANTPRLIRLERGRGGVSSPPFSVREDSAQNVVAWLRANASRFSGVDSPPGTNEAKGREEENRRKVFFSLFPREESTEGDVQRGRISSLVRGARDPSFRPISRSYFREWATIFVAILTSITRQLLSIRARYWFCEQVSLDLRFFIHTRFYCTKLLSFETLY